MKKIIFYLDQSHYETMQMLKNLLIDIKLKFLKLIKKDEKELVVYFVGLV
jgi:hypothetical protein